MFFDMQFSQDKFLELLRDQIQRALPLVTNEFDNPFGGDPFIIDHLDVSGVSIDSTPSATITIAGPNGPMGIPGNMVRVKIDIGAQLTTRAKVIAAGHLGVPSSDSFGLWVKADIRAKADGDALVLTVKPVEVGSELDVLSAEDKQGLLEKMPAIDRAITLPDVAGHPLAATNAGLTLHGGAIAVFAELTPPTSASVQAWKDFFAGSFAARSGDWSIVLPKELLVDVVDDAITDAVDSFPDKDPNIEIKSEPATSWTATGAVSTATINAVNACPVGGSDIEVDLEFAVSFALVNGELQVTINVSWNLDDWDVIRCGLATVLLPGATITVIAGVLTGPIGAIITAVLTIIGFIVALVKISDKAHGELSDGVSALDPGDMNLKTIEKDDEHALIRGHVALGTLLPGMTPTLATATPAGLMLAGTLVVPTHHERTLQSVGQSPFDWSSGYSCSKHSWSAEQIEAKLGLGDPAKYPVSASIEVLTQPSSSYTPSVVSWGDALGGVTLTVHSNLPGGSGPDCKLLIRTNSGTRYAEMGHLPKETMPPSSEELVQAKFNCFKQRLPGPKRWLEALWRVDPPPFKLEIEWVHLWEVVVSKVTAGAGVELAVVNATERPRVIATLSADAKGEAVFRVATSPSEHVAIAAKHGLEHASLFVAGALLEPIARFVPRVCAIDATVVGTGSNTRVVLAAGDHVLLLGLDGTAFGRVALPGVQHVASVGNRITAHDGTRVVTLHSPDMRALVPTRSWRAAQEISHIRAHGGGVSVTMRNGTSAVLDRHLAPIAEARKVRGSRWLAEPWMQAPIRVGNYVARVQGGAVVVYRYAQRAVF